MLGRGRGVQQFTGGKVASSGAEFVQTRVGCSEATENFWFNANDRFLSRNNRFQTQPNDTTLPSVSSRTPQLGMLTGLNKHRLGKKNK